MYNLLTMSETLSQIGDWIITNFDKLGITISIPVVVSVICKIIIELIKNKKTIKNAILGATNTLVTGTDKISKQVCDFELQLNQKLEEFKNDMSSKIDTKFADLQEKRAKIYNDIVNDVKTIEPTATETIEEIKSIETVEAIETVETVETVEETKTVYSADDIMR